MREIWKDIEGTEGKYQISNCGNVISNNYRGTKQAKLLKPTLLNGYLYVHVDGRLRTVHRLVAEAFIPNPNGLPLINHKDENKTNNCVDNLEWCDHRYNLMYGGHNRNTPIFAITEDGEIEHYACLTEASVKHGVTITAISNALHGKTKRCKKKTWYLT